MPKALKERQEGQFWNWRELLKAHTERSRERLQDQPVVLCLQDTTELDFTSQPGIAGLGRLSYEAQHGLYVHPTLVVTPEGVALGVIDAWIWARQPQGQPDVKESTRWMEGYTIVADLAERTPATRFVYVADREGDLRALMDAAARRAHAADWLVRAQHNRQTASGDKLRSRVEKADPLGEAESARPSYSNRLLIYRTGNSNLSNNAATSSEDCDRSAIRTRSHCK